MRTGSIGQPIGKLGRANAYGIPVASERRFLETGRFCLTSECVKSHGGRNASQARIASCAAIYERKGDVSAVI
jgi:hypothetical protein